jgi:ankyrin repeat protein
MSTSRGSSTEGIRPVQPLPVRADLRDYAEQVQRLQSAFRTNDSSIIQLIRQHHPRLPGRAGTNDRNAVAEEQIRAAKLTRSDAQNIVARWHRFEGWPALTDHLAAIHRDNSAVLRFELAVEAIIGGDLAKLRALLKEDPNVVRARSTRFHRATLLHYVSANGVEDYRQKTPPNIVAITKLLLRAGSEVDADLDYGPEGRRIYPERSGSTTLGLAATSYHPAAAGVQIPLLETLLAAGAAVDGLPGGWNPLLAALHNGRGDAAAFLARRGARTDLEGAAGAGQLQRVKSFFDANGELCAGATKAQLEAGLIWACEYGRSSVVSFLLRMGVDIRAHAHGETALHWAAYAGHARVVEILLNHAAPVDAVDRRFSGTPLEWALYGWRNTPPESRRADYYRTVSLLVAAGARSARDWLAARGLDKALRADPRMRAALRGSPG